MVLRATRLRQPPKNLGAFTAEIAAGVRSVYGDAAARAYLERAERSFGSALSIPAAFLFGAGKRERPSAILLGIVRGDIGEITLVHVLEGSGGQGHERALLVAAVKAFRTAGAQAILCEPLLHGETSLHGAFEGLRFQETERGLFMAPLTPLFGHMPLGESLGVQDFRPAAACVAAAYEDHPGRWLHPEVRTAASAQEYLLRVLSGAYGPVLPNYCRVVYRGDACAGVLLGCEIAPGIGFILQLAVRPEYRAQGIATGMLGGFAEACARAGVGQLGLGVTLDNPARHLYESLGFRLTRPITAFTWWAERDGKA